MNNASKGRCVTVTPRGIDLEPVITALSLNRRRATKLKKLN